MGKYSRYPSYKEVDLDYVKTIPDGWKDASLSKLFRIQAGGDVQSKFFSTVKTASHSYPIYTNANDAKAVYGYTSQSNYSRNSITVSGRGEVGFAVYRDHDFDAIIRLLVLSPRVALDCRFFAYFINEVIDFNVQSSAIGQLSTLQISPYKVLIPSREEQTQIANFLDHETAKIDTLIEKQQQLIKLLKEKRQAVISYAVTKGLNPQAPTKDSGVEWLGEVPEHWVVAGFKKYLASIVDYRGKTPNKVESGRFLVTARNIKKGRINYLSSAEYVSEADYAQVMSRGVPNIGDVLFTTEAPLGEVAQVDNSDIALAQRVIKFCGQSGVLDNTYLKYFIMSDSFQDSLMTYASGSTALGIKAERLVYLRQLLPPLSEQTQIVTHIEAVTTKIDLLEQKAIAAIDLMQERRTALISAAVTGKIDVRNWQAPISQNQAMEQTA
ncbi:restriction endonuclease subunit S [Vibrio parahaemolyticus]|uniref:restriction endonuclease subunit S n=1 Tax=Vibrio parahaemolyticus TaxID=670 RepID=UPI0009B6FD41|nr:restriction endonuclease subunit S [Vibrio parahaemolyticus]OQK32285.1 type I site-specific restriction-modificationsystem, S subunit [Vibrio parahaemolyticus]